MRLVLIYGPVAAGKLTVATEVAALTGFGLVHNHLTLDLATAIFGRHGKGYESFVDETRLRAIRMAAEVGVAGMVWTMVYAADRKRFIDGYLAETEAVGAELSLVRLTCPEPELQARAGAASRIRQGKLTDPVRFAEYFANLDEPFATYPHRPSLAIDTGSTEPTSAAELIVDHYGLPRLGSVH